MPRTAGFPSLQHLNRHDASQHLHSPCLPISRASPVHLRLQRWRRGRGRSGGGQDRSHHRRHQRRRRWQRRTDQYLRHRGCSLPRLAEQGVVSPFALVSRGLPSGPLADPFSPPLSFSPSMATEEPGSSATTLTTILIPPPKGKAHDAPPALSACSRRVSGLGEGASRRKNSQAHASRDLDRVLLRRSVVVGDIHVDPCCSVTTV